MNTKLLLTLLACFSLVIKLYGQEITRNDIVKENHIHATDIKLFGISLGMTMAEVQTIVSDNSDLIWVDDKIHGTEDFRSYVYNRNESGKKNKAILYLIWKEGRAKLNRIVLFEDFKPYLIGETKSLLSREILLPGNPVSKNFLGFPDSSRVTLDVPLIKIKHTAYYYGEKGFEIIEKYNDGKLSVIFAIAEY